MLHTVYAAGTVVYCLDAEKKELLVQINLIDSLPTEVLQPAASQANQDRLKGTTV